MGFGNLSNQIVHDDGSSLSVDQLFENDGRIWFVEQKIRDDHDSTKKRGQLENFGKKALTLQNMFAEPINGIMYFIDPSFTKNIRYYRPAIEDLSYEMGMEMNIFYGKEFFEHLGHPELWEEMIMHLRRWKHEMSDTLMPNFDLDIDNTVRELRDVDPRIWQKVASNSELWEEGIIQALFPTGAALRQIATRLRDSRQHTSSRAGQLLLGRIANYYD